ncbi:alanine racemase [Gardnerella greenwoodii]|uniref:Alanine racemase n=1 Tax=Gardnerella greenwoodii 00703Dmash TaxID=698960 RepID=I4M8D1_9BIFI|nr:alanine racemase [Gardnerella greenwoodii]EIK85471.1 alanine racemase [Gardnerella greenwoodii 00703Dmash]
MSTDLSNAASNSARNSAMLEANYARALSTYPGQVIVDLKALRDNMRTLVARVAQNLQPGQNAPEVMGVVKADGYGHGLIPSALASLSGGSTWLGTAQPYEALRLRAAGIDSSRCHILTWLTSAPTTRFADLISEDIDISVGSIDSLDAVAFAARKLGKPARVHVKVDTGFGRNGFTPAGFSDALKRLQQYSSEGAIEVIGQWSHLAVADSPDVPEFVDATDRQIQQFHEFTKRMKEAGLAPKIRHLANTAATLNRPEIRFELVRPGIGLYGYEPDPAMGNSQTYGLQPAMTLQAQLGTVKTVEEGHGISYGRTYLTPNNTSTAIVPLGYADGILRSASGFDMQGARHVNKPGGPVRVETKNGARIVNVSGRVCMDQFIVDLKGDASQLGVLEGNTVTLFGPGRGLEFAEPTADDWAEAAGTISYEIMTGIGARVPRLYRNAYEVLSSSDISKLDAKSLI